MTPELPQERESSQRGLGGTTGISKKLRKQKRRKAESTTMMKDKEKKNLVSWNII